MLTAGATLSVLVVSMGDGLALPNSWNDWGWSLMLAIFAGLIPITLMMRSSPRIGATDSATLCLVEPIVAVGVAVAIMGESASLSTVCGGLMVVLSAAALIRTRTQVTLTPDLS